MKCHTDHLKFKKVGSSDKVKLKVSFEVPVDASSAFLGVCEKLGYECVSEFVWDVMDTFIREELEAAKSLKAEKELLLSNEA